VLYLAGARGLPPFLSAMLCDPISLLLNGYWGLSQLGLIFSHFEGDNSPPSSGKINYAWSYTSNSPYAFMASYLLTDNSTSFYLFL
jgi:hypothetical protein